ncbi:MAG: hypothetical protein ACX94B_11090 [Henriciella sp.]|nr:hypothetical protein [Hyphomonadaceae bacterium]
MADTSSMKELSETPPIVSLDDGIAMIEGGTAPDNICVEIGDGKTLRADGVKGLQGLLQRLRGHRMILSLSSGEIAPTVVPMRSGKPDMHPDVAAILDALKDQG